MNGFRLLRTSLVVTLALIVVASLLQAQTSVDRASGASRYFLDRQKAGSAPPTALLYYHLFLFQAHLEEVASARDSGGQQRQLLRVYLQKKIGLSDADWMKVEASSVHLAKIVKDLNGQARSVALSDRASRQSGALPGSPSPSAAKLKALEAQRQSAISSEITGMESQLSTQGKDLLHAYLQNTVARKTKSTPMTSKDIQAARAARAGANQ